MRACLAFALLLIPSLAFAAIYEVPLDKVDSEDEIIDLEERGDISTETADILYEMILNGVDLNSATRDELFDLPGLSYEDADAIILYRKNKGRIEDPTELVGAGSLTDQQLLLITPFIRLDSGPVRLPIAGKLRLRSGLSNGDFQVPGGPVAPPGFLQGTFLLPANFSAGFLMNTTRLQPGTVHYDPVRGLEAAPLGYRVHLPVAYVQWKASQRRVVVGSYNIGFAERVTFDTTHRRQPNGITVNSVPQIAVQLANYCKVGPVDPNDRDPDLCNRARGPDGQYLDNYVLDDWSVRSNLRGVAGSIEDLEVGDTARISLYAWASYQSRDLYQYEEFDQAICADPRDPDTTGPCRSPAVQVSDRGKLKYATLPGLYDELLGGAHVDFKPSERFSVGLTGYGANTYWGVPARDPQWQESFTSHFANPSPYQLQPQEWSRTVYGGPFGAVGLNARAQVGQFGLFIEGARSFDSIKEGAFGPAGGGGFGVEQRTLFNPKRHFLELSLRYYDNKFANPMGRPIAAPDELEGQAARNEAGARFRYFGKLGYDFELRTTLDLWVLPYTSRGGTAGTTNLWSLIRLDYEGYRLIAPAIWVDIRNRNLAFNEHGQCLAETTTLVEGESFAGSCDSYRFAARLDVRPLGRKLSGYVQASVSIKDDPKYKDRFMNDASVALEIRSQPTDFLQLKLRSRYLNEDLSSNTHLEDSLGTYIQATYIAGRNFKVALRYDLNVILDRRPSVLLRVPNPEHRVYLDLRAGF